MFVPIKLNNDLYTLIITAEAFSERVEFEPQKVSFYEVQAIKKRSAVALAANERLATYASSISIRDALVDVKDGEGISYINADGSGNFKLEDQTAINRKQMQLNVILSTNPMQDEQHTGIRTVDDIHTAEEVFGENVSDEELRPTNPDFTVQDAKRALSTGKVTVYSSKDISNGAFVSTSKMMAADYAGGEKVYSKLVSVDDVAWINGDEGQFVSTETLKLYNQSAYHGSPYTFDKFDLGAIGSGEGAQVHGWGLYFAQNEETAKGYRDIKGMGFSSFKNAKGETVSYDEAVKMYYTPGNIVEASGGWDKIISYDPETNNVTAQAMKKRGGEWVVDSDYPNPRRYWSSVSQEQLKTYLEGQGYKKTGSLFEVDVPDNDVLLDEQKPFSKQSAKVKKALKELAQNEGINIDDIVHKELDGSYSNRITGKNIYENLCSQLVKKGGSWSEKEVSLLLNKYGIKGITYEGSQDGRCFVVFDDKAISVINRYNQSAAMKLSEFATYDEFADAMDKIKIGTKENSLSKKGFNFVSGKGSIITLSGSTYKHLYKDHPELTKEDIKEILYNVDNARYAVKEDAVGFNTGIIIKSKIKTPTGYAGVVLEFMGNGKVMPVTMFKDSEANIDNWALKKKQSQTLELDANGNPERILGNASFVEIVQQKLGIVNKQKWALNQNYKQMVGAEQLHQDIQAWDKLVDTYENSDKADWKKKNNGALYDFMKVPLVMQLVGVDYNDIKIYGSFFEHAVRAEHPGMTLDIVKQLPQAMVDPIMIVKGNKPNSYVFILEVENKNNAKVIVPVELNKQDKIHGIIDIVANTAYFKGNSITGAPDFSWKKERIDKNEVLYINKTKSALLMQPSGSTSPVGSAFNSALRNLILSLPNKNVKTDADLNRIKLQYLELYQNTQGIQGQIAIAENGKRIISLFKSADESTFIHEMSHMALADLKELAALENVAEQVKKDWATVKEWASFESRLAELYSLHKNFLVGKTKGLENGLENKNRATGENSRNGSIPCFKWWG